MRYFSTKLVIFVILLSMLLSACAPAAAPAEPVTLKIAVLRILDTLPMYVAQQEGLFDAKGITVEFIPAASAAERDQIITAGQADGMINEVVSTLLYNKDQIQIQIVRFARTATPTSSQYSVLAAQQSGITDVQGLKGVEIGISQGTVIEYITDRLLEAEGLAPEDIKIVAVPKIDVRMNLLGTGELKAATLPDPFSSLALQQGAVLVTDDTRHPEYGYSTISFRKPVIDEHPEAIKAFLAAIEEATALINADPTKYENVLTEQKLIPAPLLGSYKFPPFPPASVPSQDQWDDVLTWMKSKGLMDKDVSYTDSVNPSFLP
ncbi:MAG TPA: MetQ/NlpA family ABC transporter substrate-binding protein [Anaerolineales bacterium]